jgi:CheY-like chemotaxis protein
LRTASLGRESDIRDHFAEDTHSRKKTNVVVSTSETKPIRKVLIVDDEGLVRKALSRMLRPAHDVVEASSGNEALRLLDESSFDAVVCDLMMPKMSGARFHDFAIEAFPYLETRFVFLTGGAVTPETARFLERVRAPVLEKPIAPDELLGMIERTCRGARDTLDRR